MAIHVRVEPRITPKHTAPRCICRSARIGRATRKPAEMPAFGAFFDR
jgi:hypothetical protein